jgi:hypothetical protein
MTNIGTPQCTKFHDRKRNARRDVQETLSSGALQHHLLVNSSDRSASLGLMSFSTRREGDPVLSSEEAVTHLHILSLEQPALPPLSRRN